MPRINNNNGGSKGIRSDLVDIFNFYCQEVGARPNDILNTATAAGVGIDVCPATPHTIVKVNGFDVASIKIEGGHILFRYAAPLNELEALAAGFPPHLENYFENMIFGKNDVRRGTIENLTKFGMHPLKDSQTYHNLSESHLLGYIGKIDDLNNPLLLAGFCLQEQPTIANSIPLKIINQLKLRTRLILPTYEFVSFDVCNKAYAENYLTAAYRLLSNFNVEVIDTLNNTKYKSKRLEIALQAQRYISGEHLDSINADIRTRKLMTLCQVADVLLALQKSDTLVLVDEGSAGPVIEAKNIAKRLGLKKQLAALIFLEPLGLDGKREMFYSKSHKKIYLTKDAHTEAEKILSASTAGGSLDKFRERGGDYSSCPVAEIESITGMSNREKCENACYQNCLEHKKEVCVDLEKFLVDIQKGVLK